MNSLTVGSAASTILYFPRFNHLTVLLLSIWSLSPIGSQSSLQVLNVEQRPVNSSVAVTYFNTDMEPGFAEGDIWNGPSLDALFSSSLMSPASIRNSSMDMWGNVKIPDISRLYSSDTANATGWFDVSAQGNVTYSSILGIPLTDLPYDGNTTFQVETSYLALHCDNVTGKFDFPTPPSKKRFRTVTYPTARTMPLTPLLVPTRWCNSHWR